MNTGTPIIRLRLFPLAIPLRRPFRHATHERDRADPIVVEVELADHTVGYGETLPREYVSGETLESVVEDISGPLLHHLIDFRPARFADALERIDALPFHDPQGRAMTAARAGVELALLDAFSNHFHKPISEAVGWLGLPGFGTPGSTRHLRYSGVLSGGDPARLKSSIRKMRFFGMRDFKLKVGYPDDAERVRLAAAALGSSLGRNTTLRLDANGAWSLDQAIQTCRELALIPHISCLEQPLPRGQEVRLPALAAETDLCIMHDESLVAPEDMQKLLPLGPHTAFNIRISKNGGFLSAVRLAHLARKHGLPYQLGCMVGETSILSAAGRRFLENVPGVWFAEGSYGRFLLRGDVASPALGLRFGARPRPLTGPGWGIRVRPELLDQHAAFETINLPL